MRTILKLTVVAGLTLLYSLPAYSQVGCLAYEVMAQNLKNNFGEVSAAGGLAKTDTVIKIFANPDTKTWTAVRVQKNGIACILDSGTRWIVTMTGQDL